MARMIAPKRIAPRSRPDTDFMTVAEAANTIGCQPCSILNRVRRGGLTAYRRAGIDKTLLERSQVDKIFHLPTITEQEIANYV